jgi:hypothetical protein
MALVGAFDSVKRVGGGEKQEPMQKSDFIHSDLVELNKDRLARGNPGSEMTAVIGKENNYGYRDLLHLAKKYAEERKAGKATSTSRPQSVAGTASSSHPQAQAGTDTSPHMPLPHYRLPGVGEIQGAKAYHPLKLGEVRDPRKGKDWATRELMQAQDRPVSSAILHYNLLRPHSEAANLRNTAWILHSDLFRSNEGHKETLALLEKTEARFFDKKMEAYKNAERIRQEDERRKNSSYEELVGNAKKIPGVMGMVHSHERETQRKNGDKSVSVSRHDHYEHLAQARKRRMF